MTHPNTPQCPSPCGLCPERRPVPAGSEVDGERAKFEAWAKPRVFSLVVLDDDPDEYKELETASAWEAWQARAALASSVPAQAGGVAVPAGYKLVPVEPTEAMEIAGALAYESSPCHDNIGPLNDAWVAMLAAAPAATPPAGAGMVLVPVEDVAAASTALGNFVSDHGWGASDMQAMDNLDAHLAQHRARLQAFPSPAPAPAATAKGGEGRGGGPWLS